MRTSPTEIVDELGTTTRGCCVTQSTAAQAPSPGRSAYRMIVETVPAPQARAQSAAKPRTRQNTGTNSSSTRVASSPSQHQMTGCMAHSVSILGDRDPSFAVGRGFDPLAAARGLGGPRAPRRPGVVRRWVEVVRTTLPMSPLDPAEMQPGRGTDRMGKLAGSAMRPREARVRCMGSLRRAASAARMALSCVPMVAVRTAWRGAGGERGRRPVCARVEPHPTPMSRRVNAPKCPEIVAVQTSPNVGWCRRQNRWSDGARPRTGRAGGHLPVEAGRRAAGEVVSGSSATGPTCSPSSPTRWCRPRSTPRRARCGRWWSLARSVGGAGVVAARMVRRSLAATWEPRRRHPIAELLALLRLPAARPSNSPGLEGRLKGLGKSRRLDTAR